MKTLAVILIGVALCLTACSTTQTAQLNAWLQSPAVQQELGTLEGFAFTLLDDYVESHVMATSGGTIDFTPAEPSVIAQVQAKYNLTTAQATYIVQQAEAQYAAKLGLKLKARFTLF